MLKIFLTIILTLIQCNPQKSSSVNTVLTTILLLSQPSGSSTSKSFAVVIPEDTADTVTYAPNDNGDAGVFRDKNKAINGVRGSGKSAGSTDVFSLTSTGSNSSIVLEWKGKRIVNGSGIDFIVFENAFQYNNNSTTVFMEAVIVEVSQDNISYCGFSPDYINSSETIYSNNPIYWKGFAGISPVLYNIETNALTENDLYDPTKTGGDGFDLDDLTTANDYNIGCDLALSNKIKSDGFVYIRLTAATARINPDTGLTFLQDTGAFGGGPDIDGVIARYRTTR